MIETDIARHKYHGGIYHGGILDVAGNPKRAGLAIVNIFQTGQGRLYGPSERKKYRKTDH